MLNCYHSQGGQDFLKVSANWSRPTLWSGLGVFVLWLSLCDGLTKQKSSKDIDWLYTNQVISLSKRKGLKEGNQLRIYGRVRDRLHPVQEFQPDKITPIELSVLIQKNLVCVSAMLTRKFLQTRNDFAGWPAGWNPESIPTIQKFWNDLQSVRIKSSWFKCNVFGGDV